MRSLWIALAAVALAAASPAFADEEDTGSRGHEITGKRIQEIESRTTRETLHRAGEEALGEGAAATPPEETEGDEKGAE